MKIPDLDEKILGNPALTRARDRVADMVRGMPFLPGMMDDVDDALIRQCEGSNVFPKLQRNEVNAGIGQVIFEVRGGIVNETLRLLEFYEPSGSPNTMYCTYRLPLLHSMAAMGNLHYIDEQTAVLQAAFARRNAHLNGVHDGLMNEMDTFVLPKEKALKHYAEKRMHKIAFRIAELQESYEMIMETIGAIPRIKPTVY